MVSGQGIAPLQPPSGQIPGTLSETGAAYLKHAETLHLPCSHEERFQAASYAKTEADLNKDPSLYFPFLSEAVEKPRVWGITPSISWRDTGPRVSLDAATRQIHIKLPMSISVTKTIHTYRHPKLSPHTMTKCNKHKYYDCRRWFCLWLGKCGTCTREKIDRECETKTFYRQVRKESGCNGDAKFYVQIQLTASIALSGTSDGLGWKQLRWTSTEEPKDVNGSCLDFLPEVRDFNVAPVVQDTLDRSSRSWWRAHVIQQVSLSHGTRVWLHFKQPQLLQVSGTQVVAGTVMACMQSQDSSFRVANPGRHDLPQPSNGAVLLSVSLLEGLFQEEAHQLSDSALVRNVTFRHAHLQDRLHIGNVHLQSSFSQEHPSLDLTIADSNLSAECSGRRQPLLEASLQQLRGKLSVEATLAGEGLLIYAAFGDTPQVQGFLLKSPSVPLSQAAMQSHAAYVLSLFRSSINRRLQSFGLMVPHNLARYIPCQMSRGSCHNLVIRFVKGKDYIEFANVETGVAVENLAANNGIIKSCRICSWIAQLLQCRCRAGTNNVMLLAGIVILVTTLVAAIAAISDSKVYLGSWLILLALSASWCRDGPFDRFVVSAQARMVRLRPVRLQ